MELKVRLTRHIPELRVGIITENTQLQSICPTCLKGMKESEAHPCGDCVSCCTCGWCKSCFSILKTAPCGACGFCRKCCKCYACRKCGASYTHRSSLCNICGCCINQMTLHISTGGCCAAHKNTREVTRGRRPVNLARYIPSYETLRQNPSPRLLSAEIEICGVLNNTGTLNAALEGWNASVVSDGSLPVGGFEINTHPAGGDYWIAQVKDICNGLSEAGARVDSRAGCHTHVDARDFNYVDMVRALRLISCAEWGLFQLIPKVRRTSSYCGYWATHYLKAIHAADEKLKEETNERKITLLCRSAVLKPLYNSEDRATVKKVRMSKSGGSRYRAINVHSWLYRGTLEFRLPPGAVYPQNIINWGLLLGNIVDVAKGRTESEICRLTKSLEEYIFDWELYEKPVSVLALDTKFTDMSLDLVKNLCPSSEVRDWVIERVKTMKNCDKEYVENY